MTASAFDRLLYTDCRPGMGRGAGGGLQVQAQSAGVDSAQSRMAVGWLLYDVQNAWIAQRRPAEDFPLGFAHACAGGYGTAQGRYVGEEAVGGRQGNHLTDCLLTHNPDLYGPTRPAQLWRSPLWRDTPWDSKDCPQFDEIPPLGPLTVEAVADWLRDKPERERILARLVSVIERRPGRRVVITSESADEALTWIAAATLLLPARCALEVSFKVFCSNSMQADQRIVAVPKELNPQVAPGRAESVFVVDAEACLSDEAEISERARFWVGQFARTTDPYDVVDAVELADVLGSGESATDMDAVLTAYAVTVPDEPVADPPALFRWLHAAGPELLAEHGPSVVSRILTSAPSADTLRWIDMAAAQARLEIDRGAVRSLLLRAEVAEVRAGGMPPADDLIPLDIGPDARRDADSEVSSAIILGSDTEVNLLLQVARRHGVEPQLPPLIDRLQAFATGWLDNPTRACDPDRWALGEEILDLVHEELEVRLARLGTAGTLPAMRRLWHYFARRSSDPTDPLDHHWQAAAFGALPVGQRPARLQLLLERAMSSSAPAAAVSGIQRALADWEALGPAEALGVLVTVPDSLPIETEIFDLAMDEVQRHAARPTARMLDALAVIQRRKYPRMKAPLSTLLTADRQVADFVRAARSVRTREDADAVNWHLAQLQGANPGVIEARLGDLLRACIDSPYPAVGAGLLESLEPPHSRRLIDLWTRELGSAQGVHAAMCGVVWIGHSRLPDRMSSRLRRVIQDFGARLDPAPRERWVEEVGKRLADSQRLTGIWADLTADEQSKLRRVRRTRAKGGG
jgi:hypothetical protein